jgi:hypothetical protein
MIGSVQGAEAGVDFGMYGLNALYCNVGRQNSVQLIDQLGDVECFGGFVRVEMGHKGGGVNACIGTAGTRGFHILAQQDGKGVVEGLLYCWRTRLNLPPL